MHYKCYYDVLKDIINTIIKSYDLAKIIVFIDKTLIDV